jgi:hypothetical protein
MLVGSRHALSQPLMLVQGEEITGCLLRPYPKTVCAGYFLRKFPKDVSDLKSSHIWRSERDTIAELFQAPNMVALDA